MNSYKPNLTWNNHIDIIFFKILRSILDRLKHILPVFAYKTLYNSLILSQLGQARLWYFSLFYFIEAIPIGLSLIRLLQTFKKCPQLLFMLNIMHIGLLDQFLKYCSSLNLKTFIDQMFHNFITDTLAYFM